MRLGEVWFPIMFIFGASTHNVLDWGKRGEGEDRRGGKGIEGRKGGEKGDVLTTSTY